MADGARTPRSGDKVQHEFVCEVEEILERMRRDLGELEDHLASGAEGDPALLNRLFRWAHSLKGLAGMFGADSISTLAHRLEDVLDALRMGRLAPGVPAFALLGEALDLLTGLLEALDRGETASGSDPALSDLLGRIEAAAGSPPAQESTGLQALDPAWRGALTEYEEHRLRENLRRGHRVLSVEAGFDIQSFEEGLARLSASVGELGELVSTLPAPGDAPDAEIRFALLVATALEAEAFGARLDDALSDGLGEVAVTVREVLGVAPPANTAMERTARDAPASAPAVPLPRSHERVESLRSISGMVRVDIHKLDELMNLVGELGIHRSSLGDLARRLATDPQTFRAGAELAKLHHALERKLRELQERVLDARMVPLGQVFEKLARVTRQLQRQLDKRVRLELRGAETELDKLLVEELVDPLMHLVRNAFDHAIEPAEERLAAGKTEQGRIRIQAFQRGSHVVIQVDDDGRGIDALQVRARAEACGLVSADQVLSEREAFELVFLPGFSTRGRVSGTSGRGVGMDVVKANLTALGGLVDLESEPGRGTRVTLTLPITLAILQTLIVNAGGQRFAIPLSAVLETHPVEPREIQRREGRELLSLRGEPLPLLRVARELGLRDPERSETLYAVILGLGDVRVGLLVDALEGQQDAVVKPIQGPCRALRGIAGATELGDQCAVLVLDVAALVDDGLRRREAA